MTSADTDYVTNLVKTSGSSFYHGMRILPAPRRDAMYGIYAFCRLVDDIADEDAPLPEKRAELDAWRARIAALFLGQTSDAVTRALRTAVQTYDLREPDFLAIIDGMEMDAGDPIISPNLATLDLYCDRVASAVGRLSVRVFGDSSAAAQDVAYALGRALQLTNILRDVKEDAERGRVYLPFEYLSEAGVPTDDPQALLASKHLPDVCARVAELAARNFDEAESAMENCDAKAMRPARLMAASYKPLLKILRAQNFDYTRPRVSLPKWRKLALAGRLLFS
jgi:phytoene synthase